MNKVFFLWLRRIASVFSLFYCAMICQVAYYSFYYDLQIDNKLICGIVCSCGAVISAFIMLFSRKQIFTKIAAVFTIPALLPIVLIYYGNWCLIIPVAIAAIAVFFLVDMKETTKITLGTIFLLLYVLGSLAYFLICTMFQTSVQKELVKSVVSESGAYRCEIINTKDSSNGSTEVIVEPNDKDYNYKIAKFIVNGFDRKVFVERPVADDIKVEWRTVSRSEITSELLEISSEITVDLDDTKKAMLNIDPSEEVKISDLTDEDLAKLGVDENGDVLYVNDEPYFRYYIAELEGYFDSSNKTILLFSE